MLKVGFFYYFSEDWIGGSYYLESLVRMSDYTNGRVHIKLFYNDNKQGAFELKKKIKHAKVSLVYFPIPNSKIKKLLNLIIFRFIFKNTKFYLLGQSQINRFISKSKRYYWLGDVQNLILPQFFDKQTLDNRFKYQESLVINDFNIVATSVSMKSDFIRILSADESKINVAQFVSFIDLEKNNVRLVHKVHEVVPYFYVPNQFWAHKNHELLLNAVIHLKKGFLSPFKVIFTGKEYDFRFPGYTEKLKNIVKEKELEKHIEFRGFIKRADQIDLYEGALAIIQPSLYEGWNTTIEDCKALNKIVICSDLLVHREQLGERAQYFGVEDYQKLAVLMKEILFNFNSGAGIIPLVQYEYLTQRNVLSNKFYKVFND
jgi:glycosyltransferase involved in cell wall biosynthesis